MLRQITGRAAQRLRAGHLWVYRFGCRAAYGGRGRAGCRRGAGKCDGWAGEPLERPCNSDASEIALRVVFSPGWSESGRVSRRGKGTSACSDPAAEASGWEAFTGSGETDACRLVFSEADELPGIVADRYGELVVVLLLTQGTAQNGITAIKAEESRTAILSKPFLHLATRFFPPIRDQLVGEAALRWN